jgi:hypothetical protein
MEKIVRNCKPDDMNDKTTPYLAVYGLDDGWAVIPESDANDIYEDSILHGKLPPLPFHKDKPKIVYAIPDGSGYALCLGMPDDGPRLPTWAEFIEFYEIDLNDPYERGKFFENCFYLWELDDESEPKFRMDKEISEIALEIYEEDDFKHFLNPLPTARRYLESIPFYEFNEMPPGEPIGQIRLVEADESGWEIPYVWVKDFVSLALLQYCLNSTGENVRIDILEDHTLPPGG